MIAASDMKHDRATTGSATDGHPGVAESIVPSGIDTLLDRLASGHIAQRIVAAAGMARRCARVIDPDGCEILGEAESSRSGL